jgi:hypothetical protein
VRKVKKLLPIIVILLIVGVGAPLLLAKGGVFLKGVGINIPKASETFSGSLKLMIEKGVPMKCSYKQDENNSGTGYIKGRKYAGEVITNGVKSKILLIENCMYTWNEEAMQALGSKICFKPTDEKSIWDLQGESKSNYTCSPAIFSDSVFDIPTGTKFMDVGQMQ